MHSNNVHLLLDNAVKLEFVAVEVPLKSPTNPIGYHVMVRRSDDLTSNFQTLSTFRNPKKPRVFKSLAAINTLVSLEFKQDFMVKASKH